jgi:hypothetical protein
VDAAASKIAEDFFKAFEAKLLEMNPVAAAAAPAPAPVASGGSSRIWWIVGAVVIAALIAYLATKK